MTFTSTISRALTNIIFFIDFVILRNIQIIQLFSTIPLLASFLAFLKYLCHLCSKRTFLHRLCSDRKLWIMRPGKLIHLIAIHLRQSRALKTEAKNIFNHAANSNIDLDRITKVIALRKGIPLDSDAFTVLKVGIFRIFQLERLISTLIKRARTRYNPETDKVLLDRLWLNFNPSTSDQNGQISIPDERWKELGFQGTDPSTDFRGMGLLGLDHLVAFSEKFPKSAHNIFQQSKLGTAWFTFATVGINITALIYGLVISHTADQYFYQTVGSFNDAIDSIYAAVFEHFSQYWVIEEAKDVMDFSRIFAKLKKNIETNLEKSSTFFL